MLCHLMSDMVNWKMIKKPRSQAPLKEIIMMAVERGEKLLNEVKQKASKTNIDVKTDVIIGYTSVAKSIVEYAEERNMDLIVIGTRDMTGIKKMLLGSTATGV